jgi:VanZ family protein
MAPRATWRRGLWLWGPPTIYALAIFVSSSLSAPPSPPPQLTDKHVHALAYAGLALVLVRALAGGRWSGLTVVAGLQATMAAIAYGASDEWHQSFVPGRHAELRDLAADAVGAALAVGVLVAGAWWSRRSERTDGTIERAAGRVGQTP